MMAMTVRTKKPSNNKYYLRTADGGYNQAVKGSPYDRTATVLSNCVGYANGRFAEIQGKGYIKYQLICDAENFIEHAKRMGLKVQQKPCKGGIMVWKCGSIYSSADGRGHVAIVEKDESEMGEGIIYTSESCAGGSAFYNAKRSNKNGRWGMGSKYQYRGCIVNPAVPVKTLKVGSVIKIRKGAKQYGKSAGFADFVYQTKYKVIEISGDRVVFATNNKAETVIGAVRKSDCIVQ